ncbi:sodium:calcium antiporter [Chloroflexota bacterium]
MVWFKFIICILIIFFSGRQIAKHGDIIAEKSGLGGVWIGLILLASITSLPELFTGVSAILLVDAPDLTVGDLLGANAFNLFNLALLDIAHKNSSIIATASQTHRLTGWLSLMLILVVAISIFISSRFYNMPMGWIGWYTPIIILLYFFSVRKIFLFEKHQSTHQETKLCYEEESAGKAYLYFFISAAFIIGAGIWLATIGEEIAQTYGWGQSFIGSLFLAFTTTLPEITVSFTAMRMGAKDIAVANLIGSNLFNLTIIPIDDLIYLKGPVLAAVSESNLITALAVMLMTLIFIVGLRFKPRRFFRLSWWNCSLIALFLISAYFSFIMA